MILLLVRGRLQDVCPPLLCSARFLMAFCLFGLAAAGWCHPCNAESPVVENKPPVVMIVLDDLFDYRMSRNRFGVTIQTPNLDDLSARGTTFSNAFCSVSVCNASRSSALSGLSPIRTKIHQPEPLHFFDTLSVDDTLMVMMKQAGYHVAGTGKVMHNSLRAVDRPQLEEMHDEFFQARGRLKLRAGRVADIQPAGVLSADDRNVAWAADKLRNWNGEGDPLFLSVGIIRPHAPFIAPQEFFDLYDRTAIRVPGGTEEDLLDVSLFYRMFRLIANYALYLFNADLEEQFIHGYLASTSYADAKVGEILDAIDSNPALADARILLWSDNGYELGDKNTWNKFTLWETSTKVPLIVVDPSLPAGKTIRHSVSLLDVAPTVLEWAGESAPANFGGVSLLETGAIRNDPDVRSVLSTMLGSCSIRRRDMRLNLYSDGSVELYQMRVDPFQRTNLAALPQWQPTLDALKLALVNEVQRQGGVINPGSEFLDGTPEDDVLFVVGQQYASGGLGDDIYFTVDGLVNESPNGGNDTVFFANVDFDIAANVETVSSQPFLNNLFGAPIWKVTGNSQANTIHVFGGQGDVHAGFGDDKIVATGSRDSLYGENGRDVIYAGPNNDILSGGQGADQLFGEAGDDDLDGGTGADVLSGGSGSDQFRFPEDNFRDVVIDFEFGEDTILLHSATSLHGLTLVQIRDRLIQVSANEVLITDDEGKRMLIQNAKLLQVLNSLEKE